MQGGGGAEGCGLVLSGCFGRLERRGVWDGVVANGGADVTGIDRCGWERLFSLVRNHNSRRRSQG